jgi:glycosyltransferase involved in cell wall biosynthesis
MRVLILTKIFPNAVEPGSSPFNRQQFAALSRRCEVDVLATVPWFPGVGRFRRWSQAGRLLSVPKLEVIDGLDVRHPRFVYLPKLDKGVSGPLYAASLAGQVLEYLGHVDVVLGSWAYPDGYAAVLLSALLGAPAVVKVHGSDINVLAREAGPRRRLQWALPRAARVVAVSRALADRVAELGVPRERIDLVPNGIDTRLFRPGDRLQARRRLGLDARTLQVLCLARVEREKGALDLVSAFGLSPLRRAALISMVGAGSASAECERLAKRLGVSLRLAGAKPHAEVADELAACDVLALPSWNEGMPNAVLEALASGRKVVATRVGGVPEIVSSNELGLLVPPRNPPALARALERALGEPYDPAALSARVSIPDWDESARLLHQSLLATTAGRAERAA